MTGRNFSICLGVDRYDDKRLANLNFAASDAESLHVLARDLLEYGGRALLLPPDIDSVQFMHELRKFLIIKEVKVSDRVLVYFAGHGMQLASKGDHFLLLARTHVDHLAQGHLAGNDVLSVSALMAEFDLYTADFALVLDACRSPPGAKDTERTYDTIENVLAGLAARDIHPVRSTSKAHKAPPRRSAHLIINSCGDKGRAHEVSSLSHGLFANAFEGWLRDTVTARQPAVLSEQFIEELERRMSTAGEMAGIRVRQKPWISHSDATFPLHVQRHDDKAARASTGDQGAAARSNEASTPPGATDGAPPARRSTRVPVGEDFRDADVLWSPAMRVLVGSPPDARAPFGIAVSVDPITVGQFLSLTGGRDPRRPSEHRRLRFVEHPDMPVTLVTLDLCETWVYMLNRRMQEVLGPVAPTYRLLTREEWFYGCSCGVKTAYFIGMTARQDISVQDAVFRYSEIGGGLRYRPAGNPSHPALVQDPRNKVNALGLRGMHGNVRELVVNAGPPRRTHFMGGGFKSGPNDLKCLHSMPAPVSEPWDDVGFRVARNLCADEAPAFR